MASMLHLTTLLACMGVCVCTNPTFNFLQYNKECSQTDAWSHNTLEQMMKSAGEHCDPRKLLICKKDSKGRPTCQCGLVNAKYDSGRKRCVALAGGPCGRDGLFGIAQLKLEEIDCDNSLQLICKKPFSDQGTYARCECAMGRPDHEGSCKGWLGSGTSIQPCLTIIFTFIFLQL